MIAKCVHGTAIGRQSGAAVLEFPSDDRRLSGNFSFNRIQFVHQTFVLVSFRACQHIDQYY
jgi:hypothetical protein